MNSGEHNNYYSTILKYFEDKASEEEVALISEWLGSTENRNKCENNLHLLWKELDTDAKNTEIDLEALLDRIHHSIHLKSGKRTTEKVFRKRHNTATSFNHIILNLGRIAAILLFPVMGYIGWELVSQNMWEKNQAEVLYNEIKCPLGAISKFELPDGTRGVLNNGSTLKYPVKFSGSAREVKLYGEAFFDVQHYRKRPFIIRTVGLDVKVLGTRLNVYSYPDEDYQEITLESGSLELLLLDGDQLVTVAEMKSGQHVVYNFSDGGSDVRVESKDKDPVKLEEQIVYRLEKGEIYLKNDETEQYTGWKDGKLVLRNDPMPILLKRMERWYSVKFNIMDERINNYTYWATFGPESIDQVLNLLSLTGPMKFIKHPREKEADGTMKKQEIDVIIE